eukprot:m.169968 g.169968  ORF g.169968 m.169968 type:complete len:86 (-) comp25132_c0_seq2:1185-1442(-)
MEILPSPSLSSPLSSTIKKNRAITTPTDQYHPILQTCSCRLSHGHGRKQIALGSQLLPKVYHMHTVSFCPSLEAKKDPSSANTAV